MRRSLSKETIVRIARQRSSALIITLFFVCLMTILLVGFLASMRMETFSARSHFNGVVADLYAQAGTDSALARLYAVTSDSKRFWITQPGRLTASPSQTNQPVTTIVDLSSGAETNGASASADEAVNLNPTTLASASAYLIASTNSGMPTAPMYVKWIYQHQDGTLDTVVPTTGNYSASNPVVGRYAFWVDDESSKINLNTAWTRSSSNTNGLAYPSRIELSSLSPLGSTDVDAIHAYRANSSYFNTVDDARQVNATVQSMVNTDNFALTTYNHSPEVNMFGEPRILLTTQKWLADAAGTTNFLDILSTESTANSGSAHVDPGLPALLDAAKVATVVQKITSELTRTDWPIMPGQSFAAKYSGQTDPAQIAINIIDYVRCAESTNDIVEPMRGTVTGGTSFTLTPGNGTRMGVTRRPLISEFGLWLSTPAHNVTGTNYNFNWTAKTKISLPPNYGLKSVDLTQIFLNLHVGTFTNGYAFNVSTWPAAIQASEVTAGSATLLAGQSATVTRAGLRKIDYISATLPSSAIVQPVLDLNVTSPLNHTIDVGDMSGGASVSLTGGSILSMPSVAANDPCLSFVDADWKATAANTFDVANLYGPAPICTTNLPTSTTPPQDTDDAAGQKITDAGMHMPAPKATIPVDATAQTTNPLGMVYSVAELGYIHTGIDGASGVSGVPWRTLRLQPDSTSATTLPDWAMLDLFSAPFSVLSGDTPYLYPGNTTNSYVNVGGKININNAITPFTDSSKVPLSRLQPLQALLLSASQNGSSTVTSANASTLANNIANHVLASTGRSFANTNIYYTPGQLAEVQGIADSGESSEALMREVSSLATTRGNVFSVYSVGQALKQDRFGALHVLAERRTQKIFERVNSNGTVMFLPVYSKDLQP